MPHAALPHRNALSLFLTAAAVLIAAGCAVARADEAPPTTASADDARLLRQMLAGINAWPGSSPQEFEPLKNDLAQIAGGISDARLKDATQKLLPELERATLLRARTKTLADEIRAAHGESTFEAGGPDWLRRLVGYDPMQVFLRMSVVDLFDRNIAPKSGKINSAVNDAWLQRLAGLTQVKYLELASTDITNKSMKVVGTMTGLERLSITLTPVTDPGLAHLSGLTNLRQFSLASSKCTGAGLVHLRGIPVETLNFHSAPANDAGLEAIGLFPSLIRLEIVHTHFTDAGAQHLSKLINLQRLQIGSRDATAAAVAPVRGLKQLYELDLHDNQATLEGLQYASEVTSLYVLRYYGPLDDVGLDPILKLTNLRTLVIPGAQLTDAGLARLAALKHLTFLNVAAPKATDAAIQALQKALPNLKIVR